MLDNTVGGSLSSGEHPIDCIVRESAEEASFLENYIRQNIKAVVLCLIRCHGPMMEGPGCQHQVQYLYKIELLTEVVPKPFDGEMEELTPKRIDGVRSALVHGEFKLSCAMTWMAYLIRHGVVNAEDEPSLVEICARLHRKHDIFII